MTNRLGIESSPYLRQHAENPVDWYRWGPEAFAEAERRQSPILLSVGYSACHWCHVMAHECFEDPEVAAQMNQRFVNIKVDREERPEVDSLYMEAVQVLTGRGGWPLTVFLDSKGRPFFGGTYYPKATFLELMAAVTDAWLTRRDELDENAVAILEVVEASARIAATESLPPLDLINPTLEALGRAFDPEWGGFGSAPKFPQTMHLELVLWAHSRSHSPVAAEVVTTTLDAMASGGMYDHLGGGFARYSTDQKWLVPHFEKMLYDQALLVRIYLHAWAVLGKEQWRQVVTETIEFVLRDLRHERGGLFSALDADSPKTVDPGAPAVEGASMTWTPEEVRQVLGVAAQGALSWWGITTEGNFEGGSIPHRSFARGELARGSEIEAARSALLQARQNRPQPGLDDKVLTEWNALMVSTLAEAAAVSGRDDWLLAASECGEFLWSELRDASGRWYRTWQASAQPQARHMATAADHAALIDAFTRLFEASGQAKWIERARSTADVLLDHFVDQDQGGLFTVADDAEQLVVRQKDLMDSSTPCANATAAVALMRLAALTGEARYAHQADRILQLLGAVAGQAPTAVSAGLFALGLRHQGISELVITGDRPDLVRVAHSIWRPDVVIAWGEPYDTPLWAHRQPDTAYLCRESMCEAPQTTPEGLRAQLLHPTGTLTTPPDE
jgi:uncharacterized protein YyaL (SSP411 family)